MNKVIILFFFYEEYKRMKSRIELQEILAEAENDVNNKRTAPIAETFDTDVAEK